MKHVWLACFLLVVVCQPSMAAADASRLVDLRWYQVESPNFHIISNGEPKQVEKLARAELESV